MDREQYDNYAINADLQRQGSDLDNMKYVPQMYEQMQQNQAILVEQTDPKKVVKTIIMRLQGREERPDGTIVQWGKPKMNRAGIENFKYILDSFINQNTIFTHLDDKQISKIIIEVADMITDDLTLNWKAYGIINKTDLDTIHDTVIINIFNSLNRALGQNEKNWIKSFTVENVSNAPRLQSPKKEGFLSKFKL
jgi:hypothetical protein